MDKCAPPTSNHATKVNCRNIAIALIDQQSKRVMACSGQPSFFEIILSCKIKPTY